MNHPLPPKSFWLENDGRALLDTVKHLAETVSFDAAKTALLIRKEIPEMSPERRAEAIELALGSKRTEELFGPALHGSLISRIALEQCTRPEVAKHHATRFKGCRHVLEIGTGAGFDTAALARTVDHVTTIDASEEVAARAAHNLKLRGVSNVTTLAGRAEEIISSLSLDSFDGIWSDPSRRDAHGERIRDPEEYGPPLSFVSGIECRGPVGIKISPAFHINPALGTAREFIGVGSECIEQTLWRNCEKVVDGSVFLADRGVAWVPDATLPTAPTIEAGPSCRGGYLLEPHAAIIASGTWRTFFQSCGASLLAKDLAYGFSREAPSISPLFSAFHILDIFRYTPRALSQRITELGWNSRTEIKKRNFLESPELIRKKLKLPPPDSKHESYGTILLTRIEGTPLAILGLRIQGHE